MTWLIRWWWIARCRGRRSRPSWPSCARAPRISRLSCGAFATRSGCGSAPAISWAASRFEKSPASWLTWPRQLSRRWPVTSGSGKVSRFGTPRCSASGRRDRWAILALGKFGGRELNYHSDLDLVFLHEADGQTAGKSSSISNDSVRHRGCPAPFEGPGQWFGDRSALPGRRPAAAARGFGVPGTDFGLVSRLLSAIEFDLGTNDTDAFPRDLCHRRVRPR